MEFWNITKITGYNDGNNLHVRHDPSRKGLVMYKWHFLGRHGYNPKWAWSPEVSEPVGVVAGQLVCIRDHPLTQNPPKLLQVRVLHLTSRERAQSDNYVVEPN